MIACATKKMATDTGQSYSMGSSREVAHDKGYGTAGGMALRIICC